MMVSNCARLKAVKDMTEIVQVYMRSSASLYGQLYMVHCGAYQQQEVFNFKLLPSADHLSSFHHAYIRYVVSEWLRRC